MKTQLPDAAVEAAVLSAVTGRAPGRTLCPSAVARGLAADWRPLMGAVRAAAARLAARGLVVVTQRGVAVDALTARGPIRLGRPVTPPRA